MKAAALLLATLALAGCERRVGHVFGAYAYDPDGGIDGGCLQGSAAVDIIDGPPPAAPCKQVKCWVGPEGSAYITDMACDAPADFRDGTQDTSGACVKALAAYEADGGAIRCPAQPDAGS